MPDLAEPTKTSDEKPSERGLTRSRIIALVVASSFFMESLDSSVITTSLPQIAETFAVRPVDLSIGLSAYLLTIAAFIPISGWVADRFGARTVFSCAIVVFTLASVLCGAVNGLTEFVGARILQGIGGAMMVPVGRLVVLRSTEKHELMAAIAFLTWPSLAAPILGPPVGGFITTYFGWRWIFFINVPFGIAAIALSLWLIPNLRGQNARRFDWIGFLLSSTACFTLMYGLEQVAQPHAPAYVAYPLVAIGLGLGALALRHLSRTKEPLIDIAALKIPTFGFFVWGGSLFRIPIASVPFLMPLMFQVGFGMSAFETGLLVIAVFAGNLVMKPGTSWVLRTFGFRNTMIWNGMVIVASLWGAALLYSTTPTAVILFVLFIGGLCRSMQFTTLMTMAFSDVPENLKSGASTLNSMTQQLGNGMGVALGAITLNLVQMFHGESGAQSIGDFHTAFVVAGLMALCGVSLALSIAKDAGAEVSGHRR